MGAADVLYQRLPTVAAATASAVGAEFDTTRITGLAVDVTVTAITGGASPTITFFIDRLGADGLWYTTVSSTALTAPGVVSMDLVPALGIAIVAAPLTSAAQHLVLTQRARFRWAFGGGTPPTSVTFSASVVGRAD